MAKIPICTRPVHVLLETRNFRLGRLLDEASSKISPQKICSTVITPMKDLLAFRSRQLASTNRVQAQKKTQFTNISQIRLMTNVLEQATLGASET